MTVRSVLGLIPCWPWKSAGKENGGTEDRQLKANNPEFNKPHKFRSNFIQTYKYNVLTFLPLNLFEQFQRAANLYFLFQIIIMAIPQLTALNPLSTAIPLLLVLLITAVKDAYDDIGRHQSDNRLNGQIARVVSPAGSVTETKWCDIQVGNVLKVSSNEPVAADILLLSTSEASGLCFIETAELDGETNLKVRAPLVDVCEALGSSLEAMSKFDGEIVCELPNNRLEKFQGNLMWRSEKFSLDNSNIVLRGCVLRNTAWVFGVVVYAGHDSKLMMNSGESVFKRTKLDKMTNKLVIGIAILLAIICLFCSIMSYVWEDKTGRPFQLYLEWASYYKNSPALIGLFHFPGFIMVLNTLIPISLYISIEVIRLGQSLLINWDLNLYHEETDTPAKARNTALSEELGQIQYIFSDKTGTLTQNVMTFKECSINGEMYGHVTEGDMTDGKLPSEDDLDYVDFSSNRYADPNFKFHDFKLKDLCDTGEKHVSEFFTLIALCHTVMVEDKQQDEVDNKRSSTGDSTMLDVPDRASRSSSSASLSGKLLYQAQSPDEGALVSAARNFGFIFKRRTPNSVVVETNKTEETYEILNILDFDNVRKRMSVIVRKDGKIKLFCKGADTIMFGLLSRNSGSLKNATQEHLDAFASNGLRTLCLASKELSEKEYADWDEKYTLASQAMEERDEKLFQVYEEIEKDLDLLGATAIEDKLQDGVPETIANLADANIKIWVLTGDKQETAVNIGYSCMLLTDDMNEIFTVDGDSKDAVREQIRACAAKVKEYTPVRNSALGHAPRVTFSDPSGSREKINVEEPKMETIYESEGGFALVVPGKSLAFALETDLELEFLELAKACKAVICCRVTPLQKALVVDLVKRNVKATTLAIGDGANDVSMIKAAHIGVGISGREGRQAVLSADFSFAQFRFLERLLLVHGRWSYWRMSKFLNYFFYKNFAFTLVQFWYNLFSGFSAQTLYDPWFISVYNVCFTSLPVLAMGILDQDVSEKNCLDYPKLYVPGQQNRLFNKYTFAGKLVHGLVTSCLMFFIPYGIYKDLTDSDGLGHSDLNFFAVAVGCILVIVVNLQMALDTAHWTWINHFFIWGSIVFYFLYTITLNSEFIHSIGPAQFNTVGAAYNVYGSGHLWATLFLTAVLCLCPIVGSRWVSQKAWPTLTELIRRGEWKQRKVKTTVLEMRYSQRNTRQRASWRRRSGYAFAQTPGIGSMIMSGKWIPKKLKLSNLTKSRSLDLLSKSREPTDGKSRSLDNRRTDESVTPATRKSTT